MGTSRRPGSAERPIEGGARGGHADVVPTTAPPPALNVLVVDDHPALRQGLVDLLGQEPGLRPVGALATEDEVIAHLLRGRPDVIVLDYALGRGDGLGICFRVKQLPDAPRVVLYSAYFDALFAVPASVAQADA